MGDAWRRNWRGDTKRARSGRLAAKKHGRSEGAWSGTFAAASQKNDATNEKK
jgi:hypothetical protein